MATISLLITIIIFSIINVCNSTPCTRYNNETSTCYIDRYTKWKAQDGNISCDKRWKTCILTCSGDKYSCGSDHDQDNDGDTIKPSISCNGNNNQELLLICDSNEACYQSNIYSNNCSLIEIRINGMAQNKMLIYAPNYGDLNISIISEYSSFSYNTIYSGISTKSLNIDCTNNAMKCTKNIIYAQTAQSLTYLCDSYCDSTTIHCPINDNMINNDNSICNLYCSNSCNNLVIDAPNNDNLNFICDEIECKNSVISCKINNTMYQSHFSLSSNDANDENNKEKFGTMIGACSDSDDTSIYNKNEIETISTSLKINIYYNDSYNDSLTETNINLYSKSIKDAIIETYEIIRKNEIKYQQVSIFDFLNISFCVLFNQQISKSNKCQIDNYNFYHLNILSSSQFIASAILDISTNYDIDINTNKQYIIDTIQSDTFSIYFQENMKIKQTQFECIEINVEDNIIMINNGSTNNENINKETNENNNRITRRMIYLIIIASIIIVVICSIGVLFIIYKLKHNQEITKMEEMEELEEMEKMKIKKNMNNNTNNNNNNNGTKHRRLSSVASKSKSSIISYSVNMNGPRLKNRNSINSIDDELCSIEEEAKQRKRSFHWGFTDAEEKYGEIKDKSPSPFVPFVPLKSDRKSSASYSRRYINNPRYELKRRMTENSIPEETEDETKNNNNNNETMPITIASSSPYNQYNQFNQFNQYNLSAIHQYVGHHPKSTQSVSSIEIEDLFNNPIDNDQEGTSIGHTSSITSNVSCYSMHQRSNNHLPSTFPIKQNCKPYHSKNYEKSRSSIEKMDDDLDDWDPKTATELLNTDDSLDSETSDNEIEPCIKNSNSDFRSLSSRVDTDNDTNDTNDTIVEMIHSDHYDIEQSPDSQLIKPKININSTRNYLNVGAHHNHHNHHNHHSVEDVFSTETGPDLPSSPSNITKTEHEQTTIIDVENVLNNKDLDIKQNNSVSPKSNQLTTGATVAIPSFAPNQSFESNDTNTTETTGSAGTSQPKLDREHHRNIMSISQMAPNYWD